MQKFFVDSEQIIDNNINITGDDVNHIANVLHIFEGEEVLVGNKQNGITYLCKIKTITKQNVLLDIVRTLESDAEPRTYIHIFQGLPKADKMEHIIQKGTEIGISEFTPVIMSRCIAKLEEKDAKKKIERWQKIALTAAKQCKRDKIPRVNLQNNLKKLYENLQEYDIVFIAYEEEKTHTLKEELSKYKSKEDKNNRIAVIIGPEGGLSKEEVDFLVQNGGISVSLGKRILRTETAPLVMSAIILYELGDMN